MPTDGIFRIMSLGKPITGVALLQQMEAGKIDEAWHREPDDAESANKALPRTAGPNPMASYFSGSFGLFCTARDSLLFETMLLNEGTIHGKRVLRPGSVGLVIADALVS